MKMNKDIYEHMVKIAIDIDDEIEVQLIRKIQKNPNDFRSWQALKARMSPAIQSAINSVTLTSPNLSAENIKAAVMKRFETSVMSYDPDKGIKPSTYITSGIQGEVRKIDDSSRFYTRQSSTLSQKSKMIHTGREYYKLHHDGKEPTVDELYDVLRNELGHATIKKNEIVNSMKYARREYSSDVVMSDNDGEDITWGDVNNVQPFTPEEYMERSSKDAAIDAAAKKALNQRELKIFNEWTRRGPYKNDPRKKIPLSALAINNNMTYQEAKEMVANIEKKVGNELRKLI
jgi:DNA-directed RNA polymerase specialized sigma subunit